MVVDKVFWWLCHHKMSFHYLSSQVWSRQLGALLLVSYSMVYLWPHHLWISCQSCCFQHQKTDLNSVFIVLEMIVRFKSMSYYNYFLFAASIAGSRTNWPPRGQFNSANHWAIVQLVLWIMINKWRPLKRLFNILACKTLDISSYTTQ